MTLRFEAELELLSSAEADSNRYSLSSTAYAVGCNMPPLARLGLE